MEQTPPRCTQTVIYESGWFITSIQSSVSLTMIYESGWFITPPSSHRSGPWSFGLRRLTFGACEEEARLLDPPRPGREREAPRGFAWMRKRLTPPTTGRGSNSAAWSSSCRAGTSQLLPTAPAVHTRCPRHLMARPRTHRLPRNDISTPRNLRQLSRCTAAAREVCSPLLPTCTRCTKLVP